jgi:hypothetical protein
MVPVPLGRLYPQSGPIGMLACAMPSPLSRIWPNIGADEPVGAVIGAPIARYQTVQRSPIAAPLDWLHVDALKVCGRWQSSADERELPCAEADLRLDPAGRVGFRRAPIGPWYR